ncbi:MAG: hypothetical protein ACI32C_01520 [Candidatus Enteromonas sp.]
MEQINEEDRIIEITREDGITETFKILFTFHNDERNKDYYFLYKDEDEDTLMCLSSSDGESFEYLSDEEQDEAEQVLDAYNEDPLMAEAKE